MPSLAPDQIILHGSDAQLRTLLLQSPRLTAHGGIVLLRRDFLAKAYRADELEDVVKTIELARSLCIRTPQLVRTVACDDAEFLIMQRIDGVTVEDSWHTFGWYTSLRLAFQLRHFISSIRACTSDTAGSLATGKCRSFWLDDRFGLPARPTVGCVMDFLAFWTEFRSIKHEYKKGSQDHATLLRSPDLDVNTFVLTHHDLAPRNIMVDALGDAWILDWDLAGYYPVYFEYASMSNFKIPDTWSFWARLRWRVTSWIAAGWYGRQSKQLWAIRSKFQRFTAGRRINIKAKVTQSRFNKSFDSSDSSIENA